MRVDVCRGWALLVLLATGCAAKQQAAHPPTPPSPAPAPTTAQVANTPALTPEEQRDALDRRLGDSLSAFDAMLLKEQKELAEKRAEQAPAGGGAGGEGSAGAASGAGGTQSTGRDKTEKGGEGSAQKVEGDRSTGSSRGGGSSKRGGRSTTNAPEGEDRSSHPPDVGDGRDDDVVARQIREAATKERDPAIREKLWDEYRRYKGIRKGES